MSLFSITDDRKTYGHLNMPDETCLLTDRQHKTLWTRYRLHVNIKYVLDGVSG